MRSAFTRSVMATGLALLLVAPAAARAGLFEREDEDVAAGNRALAAGNAEEALRRYAAAAEDHPDAPEVAHDRGAALLAAGQPDQALQAFGEALARRPEGKPTAADHAAIGTALAALGRDAEARAELQRALELDPEQATARKNLEALLRKAERERQEQQQAANEPDQEKDPQQGGETPEQGQEQQRAGDEERQGQDPQPQAGNEPEPEDGRQAGNEPEPEDGQQAGNESEPHDGQRAGNEPEPEDGQPPAAGAQAGAEPQDPAGAPAGAASAAEAAPSGPIDRTRAEQLLDALQQGERPYQLYRRQRDRGQRTAHEKDW